MNRLSLQLYLLSILLLAMPSCSKNTLSIDQIDPDNPVLLFVPGYKGTTLYNKEDDSKTWLSASQALFGSTSLQWHHPKLGLPAEDRFRAGEVMKEISVIPGVYAIDIYGSCINGLEKHFGDKVQLIQFSYDWRQDSMKTISELDSFIKEIAETGAKNVSVLAHSMGGMFLTYYLRYGSVEPEQAVENWQPSQYFQKIIISGPPLKGSMLMFRDQQRGSTQGRNKKILDAMSIASLPAAFQLLPARNEELLYTKDLQKVGDLVYSPEAWIENNWGILNQFSTLDPDIQQARLEYVTRGLLRGNRFYQLLQKDIETDVQQSKIPLLFMQGVGTPTLDKGIYNPEYTHSLAFEEVAEQFSKKGVDVLVEGDGVVTTASATLPAAYAEAFDVKTEQLEVAHHLLCGDPKGLQVITNFLDSK